MLRGFIAFLVIWWMLYFGFTMLRLFVKNTNATQKISLLKGLLLTGFLAILASVVLTLVVIIF